MESKRIEELGYIKIQDNKKREYYLKNYNGIDVVIEFDKDRKVISCVQLNNNEGEVNDNDLLVFVDDIKKLKEQ